MIRPISALCLLMLSSCSISKPQAPERFDSALKDFCDPRPVLSKPAVMADLVEHTLELTMLYDACSAKNTAKANALQKLEHNQ